MWFDTTKAQSELGWRPEWSADAMFADAYDAWLAERGRAAAAPRSSHRAPVKAGVLAGVKGAVRLVSRGQAAARSRSS